MNAVQVYIVDEKKHLAISTDKINYLHCKVHGEWIVILNDKTEYSTKKFKMQIIIDGVIVHDRTPRSKIK